MHVGQTDFGEHPVRVMCYWMTWIQLVGWYSPCKVSWIVHRWCIWSVSCGKCAMNFTDMVSNEHLSACLVYPMQHSLSVSLHRSLHELLVDWGLNLVSVTATMSSNLGKQVFLLGATWVLDLREINMIIPIKVYDSSVGLSGICKYKHVISCGTWLVR